MGLQPKSRGKRYSDQEKSEVLQFVEGVNRERGRGGVSAAAKKFGVTPLTVSNWVRQDGGELASPTPHSAKEFSAIVRRLGELHQQLTRTREEINRLRQESARLRSNF